MSRLLPALALAIALLPGARDVAADVGLPPAEPIPSPPASEAPMGDDVVEGSKMAGQEALALPGIAVGGGVLVLDEDGGSTETYTRLALRSHFAIWQLKFGILAELNLDDDLEPRIEDWDEPSDFPSRFVDYVELFEPGHTIYAYLGRLRGKTLGHGTLFAHYQSAIDLDSRKTGAHAALNLDYLGFEALTNDVTSAEVLAARAYISPLGWLGIPIIKDARVTAQLAIDRLAPDTLRVGEDGRPKLDDDGNYRYHEDPIAGMGVGVEVPIFRRLPILGSMLDLTPYAELNALSGHGAGLHLGAEMLLDLPLLDSIGLGLQGEYRVLDSEYLPGYFDAQYEINRFAYPDPDSPRTKRRYLKDVVAQNGYMARVGLRLPYVEASASWEGFVENEENNRLVMGLEVTGLPYVQARFLYTKEGARSVGDALSWQGRATFTAEVLVELMGWLYVDFQFERAFQLRKTTRVYTETDAYAPALLIGWFF